MNERPIIFTGPNVVSILEGLKTQTRRVVKLPADARHVTVDPGGTDVFGPGPYVKAHRYLREDEPGADPREAPMHPRIRCPYGYPGDRLWVKETFFQVFSPDTCQPVEPSRFCYRATHDGEVMRLDDDGGRKVNRDGTTASPWKSSLYMPRAASRLTLEIVKIRVERLHAITEKDALAEAASAALPSEGRAFDIALKEWCRWTSRLDPKAGQGSQRGAYGLLWERLHGAGAWAKNPLVWVIDFRRVTP